MCCHTQNHQVSYLKIAEKWGDQKKIVVNCCNFKPLFRSDSAVHVDLLISASFSSTKPLAKNSPLARLKSQFTRPALGRKNLLGLFENVMVRKLPHENCHFLLKNTFLDKPNMPKVPGVFALMELLADCIWISRHVRMPRNAQFRGKNMPISHRKKQWKAYPLCVTLWLVHRDQTPVR